MGEKLLVVLSCSASLMHIQANKICLTVYLQVHLILNELFPVKNIASYFIAFMHYKFFLLDVCSKMKKNTQRKKKEAIGIQSKAVENDRNDLEYIIYSTNLAIINTFVFRVQ